MKKIIKRILDINLPGDRSAFLWGPRKTGKTYWLRNRYTEVEIIDLLKTEVFADYASRPSLLREQYREHEGLIVIDEIQWERNRGKRQGRKELFSNLGRHPAWIQDITLAKVDESATDRD